MSRLGTAREAEKLSLIGGHSAVRLLNRIGTLLGD